MSGVKWDGVISSIVLPAIFSPVVAAVVAGLGTWIVFKIVTGVPEQLRDAGFRWGQVPRCRLVSRPTSCPEAAS
jgi:inorganic phosphate transporter, PiT family